MARSPHRVRPMSKDKIPDGTAIAFSVSVLLIAIAVIGPWFTANDIASLDWAHVAAAASLTGAHWLGTDRLGGDLFARTLEGLRVSLAVACVASAISLSVGIAYGAVAGYAGGRWDQFMMRFIEVLSGLPLIFFVIFLTVIFGRSQYLLFLAIGAIGWLTMARIVRGQTLSIRAREYIEAAVGSRAGTRPLHPRHACSHLRV